MYVQHMLRDTDYGADRVHWRADHYGADRVHWCADHLGADDPITNVSRSWHHGAHSVHGCADHNGTDRVHRSANYWGADRRNHMLNVLQRRLRVLSLRRNLLRHRHYLGYMQCMLLDGSRGTDSCAHTLDNSYDSVPQQHLRLHLREWLRGGPGVSQHVFGRCWGRAVHEVCVRLLLHVRQWRRRRQRLGQRRRGFNH